MNGDEQSADSRAETAIHAAQVSSDRTPGDVADIAVEQDEEAAEYAKKFLVSLLRLRSVKIDREHFLTTELHRSGIGRTQIHQSVAHGPAAAGVSPEILSAIAERAVSFETRNSSGASFISGIPGGFAMLGAIPFDIGQYYVHSLRIMQKLAYVYGWHDFLEDVDEVDDETLGILAAFFGVMMGVGGAAGMLNSFLKSTVAPAVEKNIAKQALTKTAWYVPMKKVLKIIGINVTKQSFAKSATKVVPVIGGVISGSLTFAMLSRQSNRLMEHLSELPPPLINAENSEGRVDLILSELEGSQRRQTGKGLRSAVSNYAAERRADISDIQAQLGEQVSAARRRVGTGGRSESSDTESTFTSTLATAESTDASTQDDLDGYAGSEE